MRLDYDVVVAGAGLGGLAAAAALSTGGFSTLVVEKFPRIGGRFTNITHKGFELSTGALHLLPHQKGVAKRFFKDDLKTDLDLINTGPIYYMHKGSIIGQLSKLPATIDSIFRFSIGLKFRETPLLERMKFLSKMVTDGRPCLPKGGCKSIIDILQKIILDNNGKIQKRTILRKITIQNTRVTGVKMEKSNGEITAIKTVRVISDIGLKNTLETLPKNSITNGFRTQANKIKPAEGIKISIECSKPILKKIVGKDAGLLFTPTCRNIAGIVEPSALDPNLAPPSKSLLMTYQKLASTDIQTEITLGIKELETIIPHFKRDCRVLIIQVFRDDWPVNRAQQGRDVPQKTPIDGLYLVGDGAKPPGCVMAEGAIESARRVANAIKSENHIHYVT